MLTYGAVHGGWGHLFFNMLTLFFFGRIVEQYFQLAFGGTLGIVLIGHTAHFWGAVYGLLFPLACRPDIFQHFLMQLGL